jgi:hypothetical protein
MKKQMKIEGIRAFTTSLLCCSNSVAKACYALNQLKYSAPVMWQLKGIECKIYSDAVKDLNVFHGRVCMYDFVNKLFVL